tara:strand:- start:386 stop:505 length:120 start_codon:yes stop_codon:yes gene_type:complete
MNIESETSWFDFLVIVLVFAIIPIKISLIMWLRARRDKK